jgi:hypothetical protein
MARDELRSPFTHDLWTDARPIVGVTAGIARMLHSQRPRRKPPDGFDQAVDDAIEAAFLYAGVTKLSQTGTEGENIAVAYEKAADAHRRINPFVDDDFKNFHTFWVNWALDDEGNVKPDNTSSFQRVARYAFWASKLTVKGASNPNWDAIQWDVSNIAEGVGAEATRCGITRGAGADIERSWRFVAFTGRVPGPADQEIFDAFSAALEAGEIEFARKMVQGDWES